MFLLQTGGDQNRLQPSWEKTGRRQFTDASVHTSCPSASRRWCSPWCRWLPGWTWGRQPAGGWARQSDRRAPGRWRGGCSRWPATGRTQPGPGSPAAAGNGTPCWTGSRSWSTASSAAEGLGFPTEEAGAKTKTCLMKRGCPLILWTVLLRAQRPVMTRYLRQIILKSDSLNFNLLYFCSANFRRSVTLMSLLNFVAAAHFKNLVASYKTTGCTSTKHIIYQISWSLDDIFKGRGGKVHFQKKSRSSAEDRNEHELRTLEKMWMFRNQNVKYF